MILMNIQSVRLYLYDSLNLITRLYSADNSRACNQEFFAQNCTVDVRLVQ